MIANNAVHTIGGRNVFARIGATNDLIERNTCTDPRIFSWPWDAIKAHEEEHETALRELGSWFGGREPHHVHAGDVDRDPPRGRSVLTERLRRLGRRYDDQIGKFVLPQLALDDS